jgi:hypothetical protein
MDITSIILIITTLSTLGISVVDVLINGYIGVKDKKIYSDCCCISCGYESHSESEEAGK